MDAWPERPRRLTVHRLKPSLPPKGGSEPKIERPEQENDADVRHQPLPEVVPEKEDIHTHYNGYEGKHVQHDRGLSSHHPILRVDGAPDVGRARCFGSRTGHRSELSGLMRRLASSSVEIV